MKTWELNSTFLSEVPMHLVTFYAYLAIVSSRSIKNNIALAKIVAQWNLSTDRQPCVYQIISWHACL